MKEEAGFQKYPLALTYFICGSQRISGIPPCGRMSLGEKRERKRKENLTRKIRLFLYKTFSKLK
jgi:hypothetical protein